MSALFDAAARLVRLADPETAHRLTVKALSMGLAPSPPPADPRLAVTFPVSGLTLPNPVGLAAGFDKNAEGFAALFGFGFDRSWPTKFRRKSADDEVGASCMPTSVGVSRLVVTVTALAAIGTVKRAAARMATRQWRPAGRNVHFTPTRTAAKAPMIYWPEAPMLKSPVFLAKPTDRPVMTIGVA